MQGGSNDMKEAIFASLVILDTLAHFRHFSHFGSLQLTLVTALVAPILL
jgi:hypothetical protein